jgi:hypothetical protein
MTDIDRISRHCASLLIENENLKIRIEKLEAALRYIERHAGNNSTIWYAKIARKTLEGKND